MMSPPADAEPNTAADEKLRDQTVAELVRLVGAARCDLSNEKRTQGNIADVLTGNGVEFQREYRLSSRDVVDFLVGSIALEVKLKGARKVDVFKQLQRYAQHEAVSALVLVSNLAMGLPQEIEGKPAYYVSLGRAWL